MSKKVGILTSGGDCPGLNAAIRGVVKAGAVNFGMQFLGFRDGFRGLAFNQTMALDCSMMSGVLTDGGTMLGTSRDKPHKILVEGKAKDMTDAIVQTYHEHHLDWLVCLGGGGTQKNALHLMQAGLRVVTLPKTIDNDIAKTDVSFGFSTALEIVADAIDRLHSTATSHSRVIVVETMGHRAGWLALGASIAGGADVTLIPEIPYDVKIVAEAIRQRKREGKHFSIVAVAEGAMTKEDSKSIAAILEEKANAKSKEKKAAASGKLKAFHEQHLAHTVKLTQQLEKLSGCESRLTILGHLQRGGTPSANDRILATRLGTACAEYMAADRAGDMLAVQNGKIVPVPLEEVAHRKKLVCPDDPLVRTARLVGTCFGDKL